MDNAIKNFCETKDTKFLENITRKMKIYFQKMCVKALNIKNSNKEIAKIVLNYYGLNKYGVDKTLKQKNLKEIEANIAKMSVSLTGARIGDVLTGCSKGTTGSVMKIHKVPVPPHKRKLDEIRAYPDLWKKFLVKLGSLSFFSAMDIYTRDFWLEYYQADNEDSIGAEGSRLEVLQPGNNNSDFVTKLTEKQLETLIRGNPNSSDGFWNYIQIQNMIPRKRTGTNRHTLILIRSFWKIDTTYSLVNSFDKNTINVFEGVVLSGHSKTKEEIFVFDNLTKNLEKIKNKWIRPAGGKSVQKVGLLVSKKRMMREDVANISDYVSDKERKRISHYLRNFTGASYKSLIQKIIRFRPNRVELVRQKFESALKVLLVAMENLAKHPGAFVPDIQRYVTGIESLSKRLAVITYEDSSLPEDHAGQSVLSLTSGSLIAQRVKSWYPDEKLLKKWFNIGFQTWESNKAVIVNFAEENGKKPYIISSENSSIKNASALLDELRSFQSDLEILRSCARKFPNLNYTEFRSTPDVMPLEHCVDQHWAPQLALFFDSDFVEKICVNYKTSAPFAKLFSLLWNECSSINPRRHHIDYKTFEDRPNIKEIRKAQTLYLISKQQKQKERENLRESFIFDYTLNDDWIAGLVGPIEVKIGRKQILVTLTGTDSLKFVAIRKPSRNMDINTSKLSAKEEESAIEIAKERLKRGLSLNKASAPAPILEGAIVYYNDGEDPYYTIKYKNSSKKVRWEKVKKLRFSLPYLQRIEGDMKTVLTHFGKGVEYKAKNQLDLLIKETKVSVIRRVLNYINTYGKIIEINRISRDGGGVYSAVSLLDVPAYQFMLQLSKLYPAAIAPKKFKPGFFVVNIAPILWWLKAYINDAITEDSELSSHWDKVRFSDDARELWEHQKITVNEMLENKNKGKFLWLTVGLGKTAIVLTYLQKIKEQGRLPPYIIYTVPKSAITSIVKEIQRFEVPINIIIPLKNIKKQKVGYSKLGVKISQNCKPKPYHINIIQHDHLRKCENTLLDVASESFILFDEVHKTLNDTKRSSVALEIANLSKDFIAFTGTAVVDDKLYKLIKWLKLVVPYEVNIKNFWTAANAMISKKVNTGKKIDGEDVIATFTPEDEKIYTSSVPPALGGTNTNPSAQDWKLATDISYKTCTKKMVSLTVKMLKEGKRVMIVAKDSSHMKRIRDRLLSKKVKSEDIYLLQDGSIFLTDEEVKKGNIHGYKVVIVPQRKAEGYTLTYLNVMISSVYPSNNARREQLEGRINRISQKSDTVYYRTVHAGILTYILKNHNKAKNLNIALQNLADSIEK